MSPTPEGAVADQQQVIAELRRELAEAQGRLGEVLVERDEAIAQQTATAEVLHVINASPGDLAPVFEAMLEKATRLCEAAFGIANTYDGEWFHTAALHGVPEPLAELWLSNAPALGANSPLTRIAAGEDVVHIEDFAASPGYLAGEPRPRAMVELGGAHSYLAVALRKDGKLRGTLAAYRQEVRPFTDKQIALLQNFAEQAVIAMENARLLTETRIRARDLQEALEYQTATGDVLAVISRSGGDLEPIFQTLVETAARICEADTAAIMRLEGERYHLAAAVGVPEEWKKFVRQNPIAPGRGTVTGRVALERRVIHVEDAAADPEYDLQEAQQIGRFHTALGVPLLRDGSPLAVFALGRLRIEAFSDKQIDLVRTFADQAVIAMENARLLSETREALTQQTATTEILAVINSSPGELKPVFEAILEKALLLCDVSYGVLQTYDGECFHVAAERDNAHFRESVMGPLRPEPGTTMDRIVRGENLIHIADLKEDTAYQIGSQVRRAMVDVGGFRSMVSIALRTDKTLLGALHVYRQDLRTFTDKQIALLQNFAEQAVIAMENARLLTETREALEQQTATAEVLGVINSSPGDLAPVFDAMLEKAMRLCEAQHGYMYTYDGERLHATAVRGAPQFVEFMRRRGPIRMAQITGNPLERAFRGRGLVHILDCMREEVYRTSPRFKEVIDIGGIRAGAILPLFKEETFLGSIHIFRQEVRPFTDKQVALLENFAAQAVIAMENARLLTETREALEQQTATAEVLGVINSSPGDLAPVFEAMLEKAMRLCEAAFGQLATYDGERFHTTATHGVPAAFAEYRRSNPPVYGPGTTPARILEGERVICTDDLKAETPYERGEPNRRALVDLGGARSAAIVALRKDDAVLGFIQIYRQEVRPFSDKQVALLENFAAQAVIAMENARLLGELRQRTDEVAELNRGLEARVAAQIDELGRVGRLKRFLAPQLAELIVSQGDEKILESHRREIVVVFCDLRGYTAFTEAAEPEEVLEFLREYHGALGPLVSQFEGTLDQFSGDGIMVFFNDPVPIPDPAQRAVRMAIAMRDAASALISGWRRLGRDLGFGAGIAQGYATLGQIGFSERSGYTAIGTVCNVAARLCAEAKDGQILISQRVAARLDDNIALEDIGALALKGLTQPVVAFNVPLAASQPALRVIEGGPPSD